MRRVAAVIAVAVMLAACGSDGGASGDQTEDDFLDAADAACRAATVKIDKLEASDGDAVSQLRDLLTAAHDDLDALEAPESLKEDFDDFTGNIEDQTSEISKLETAIAAGDSDGIAAATAEINTLSAAADKLANTMVAIKCRGITPPDALAPATTLPTEPPVTEPPVTEPPVTEVTTPPTDTVTTDTPTTDPPLSTTPPGEILPSDLSLGTPPPEGYKWIEADAIDVSGLYEKPIVGPLVEYYAGGRVEHIDDGHTASIYVLQISEPWTPDAIEEYQFWEGVENGTDTTTPSGIPVRQALGAFEDTDCVVFTADTSGIVVCTFTGVDGLAILDKFVEASAGG